MKFNLNTKNLYSFYNVIKILLIKQKKHCCVIKQTLKSHLSKAEEKLIEIFLHNILQLPITNFNSFLPLLLSEGSRQTHF